MGEKQIHSFLKLLDKIRKGKINIESIKPDKLKFIINSPDSLKEIYKICTDVFEHVFDQRIIAYSRNINNNQCEVYIQL